MKMKVVSLIVLLFLCIQCTRAISFRAPADTRGIELVFKWKYAEIAAFPKSVAIKGGHPNYIPENNIIYGIAYDVINDVLYATVPRSAPGVPATLLMIENVKNATEFSPIFTPFPSFALNELKKCDFRFNGQREVVVAKRKRKPSSYHQVDYSFDERYDSETELLKRSGSECNSRERLISIYDPVLDKCGRLWILDSGILEYDNGDVIVKRPQLWVFNVRKGPESAKLIRRYDFPKDLIKDGVGLTGLAVDIVNKNCEETFVYIPNQIDDRIVVYDYFKHDAWFFENYSFGGDATEADFNHEGHESRYQAGVSSIAIGPEEEDSPGHFRTIYYTAGASTGEYSISSRELRSRKKSPEVDDVKLVGYRGKDSQAMVHVYDEESGVLFFAESQTGRVRCWNSQKPLRPENIVTVFESNHFIYGSHISIDPLGNLWFMSNRFPLFKARQYDYKIHNVRLYKGLISKIIAGTACEAEEEVEVELTQENIGQFFNITQVITDDLL